MTPDQARKRTRRLDRDLLVAEAEQAAVGWMYLTVEGIDIESEPDLERYLRALELDAFGEVGRRAGVQIRQYFFPPYVRHPRRGRRADYPR